MESGSRSRRSTWLALRHFDARCARTDPATIRLIDPGVLLWRLQRLSHLELDCSARRTETVLGHAGASLAPRAGVTASRARNLIGPDRGQMGLRSAANA